MRTWLAILLIAVTGIVISGCGRHQMPGSGPNAQDVSSATSVTAMSVTATSVIGRPADISHAVGAVFVGDNDVHTCTGVVVHSRAGNLILTAAHCLAAGYSATFVPNFSDQNDRGDSWTIDSVYLDPRWVESGDPKADYAFARVDRLAGESVEQSAGAALTVHPTPESNTAIRVIAYPMGDGGPIGCDTTLVRGRQNYPTLECAGLVDGSSGAPLIVGSTVVGVIGGLDAGGCQDEVSYASPFDDQTAILLARAEASGPGDTPPGSVVTGC